jgi:hypothetical protein
VVELDDSASALESEGGWHMFQELPGIVMQIGLLPSAQSEDLPSLQSPAIVIAADTGDFTILQSSDNGVGLGAVTDQVSQADDLIDGELIQPRESRIEGPHVAVNVRDQSNPHGIEPGLFWW